MKTLEFTLKNLADVEEPVSIAGLYALSDLDQAGLQQVKAAWAALPGERRAAVMRHLVEIAEDNFETDFNAIFRLGLSDPNPGVRAAAISGLWEDEDPALINPLIKFMQSDEAEKVRAAAAGALGRFVFAGEVEDIPLTKTAPIAAALKATFMNAGETLEVRRRALEALGFLGDDETSQLIAQAYHDPDERMRLSAIFAMGRSLDDERWGAIVVEELFAADPEMRFEAARAAGELEYGPAVRQLADLLEDVDEDVQRAAVWSLGQIGGDKARLLLETVLESDAEHLHEDAEDALAELEFKANNLDFTMFDFDEDEDEEWVLDEDFDEEDDED